jgi:flagellar basal-body rod modification protein FlgD
MTTATSVSPQDNAALVAQLNRRQDRPQEGAAEINDRFLKLLVAQMNNQDPLNPLDNAQVTTQMAQISTVTGISDLAASVGRLTAQFSSLQALQAAQLTGRSVLVSGNALTAGDGPAAGGLQLAAAAQSVTVEIRDGNGTVVRTLALGALPEGTHSFKWDGLNDAGRAVAAGRYTFAVTATADAQAVGVEPLAAARIDGVRASGADTQLVLAGGRAVSFAEIKQIL